MSRLRTVATAGVGAAVAAGLAVLLTGQPRRIDRALGPADPPDGLPPGRIIPLPGRGELFVRDLPGPPGGPTIVLLHGWVVSADLNWFTSYAPVGELGRVLAPDHRGHGRGARHSTPFRLADVADDVAALIRAEVDGPAVLVGYSMGGPIAQLVWQRHPDVVAGLLCCATAAHFGFTEVLKVGWRFMGLYQVGSRLLPRSWLEWVLAVQSSGGPAAELLRRLTGADLTEVAPLLPWAVGEVQRGDTEDIAEAGRELGRFDSRGWIGQVDVPTAVLVTTRDRLVPPTAQLELAGLLPDPVVVDVDADHDASAAAAPAFNAGLRKALEHVLGAGPAPRAGDGR